jgi:hypothetical protein
MNMMSPGRPGGGMPPAPMFVPASQPGAGANPSQGPPGGAGGPGHGQATGGNGPGGHGEQGPLRIVRQPVLTLPTGAIPQTNPEFKKATDLKVKDANFSVDEHRAIHAKYFVAQLDAPAHFGADGVSASASASASDAPSGSQTQSSESGESRGKKRARAEDLF